MNYYELNYLISPDLLENEIKSLEEKIISFVQDNQGIIGTIKPFIKKELAYPIKKRKKAFFETLNFSLAPENLKNLEKKLKGEKQILRYLILKYKQKKGWEGLKKMKPVKRLRKTLPKISKEIPKVEMKEIEKKLEEILGE